MKSTNAQILERVKKVIELLINGNSREDIAQYCAEKWKVKERQTDTYIKKAKKVARRHKMKMHLDGARCLNAAVYLGISPAEMCQDFDTVSICLSKGLGCPAGSLLVGSEKDIKYCLILRKLLGGNLRQAGILCKAGLENLKDWDKKGSYTFDLRTKNLAALGKLMGAALPPAIGPAKIKGTASGKPDDLNIDMSVYAANAHTTLKGNIRQKGKAIKPDISVVTTGKNLPSTLRHLGQKDPSKALGIFHINAFVTADSRRSKLREDDDRSAVILGLDPFKKRSKFPLRLTRSRPTFS